MGGIGSGRRKATTTAKTVITKTVANTTKKASGRLPAWASTPMKKEYVIDSRVNGTVYTETTFKAWRKEVNAAKKIGIRASNKK